MTGDQDDQVLVGVVGEAAVVPARLSSAIEAAGASAVPCTEATVLATSGSVDAVVFDVGPMPERFAPIATLLHEDPGTRHVPRVLIVAGATPAERLTRFGASSIVPSASVSEALGGAVAGAVGRVRAWTEMERGLRQSNDERRSTEQHVASLREQAITLTHDSRVLFGIILGYASNLRDGIAGPVTDIQRGHAENIIAASSDAVALLDRYVLSVRQPVARSGGEEPVPESRKPPRRRLTDLGELVRTIAALFADAAAAKQIRIDASVTRGVPPVWCDAMQIKQALVNLLSNALKFTPAGGAVDLFVRPGPPASARGGATARRDVELVVSDTGAGIPVEERERVFERGARLDRDHDSPGTGIGLSVVRDVVEQHGGFVSIDDAPGGGASFVMTLPSDLRSRASDRSTEAVPE